MNKFFRSLVTAVLIAATIALVPFSGAMGVGVSAPHPKHLRAPRIVALTPHGSSISVRFDPVVGASSYTVRVFAHDSEPLVYPNVQSGDAVTGLAELTAYQLTVQAIGDGVRYSNSAQSRAYRTKTLRLTCADGGTCVLGDIGPGGGIVFYVAPTFFTEFYGPCMSSCRYLEVAPITGPGAWVPGNRAAWSANDSTVSTGAGIGSGYINTAHMIMGGSGPTYAGGAAGYYSGPNSLNDWFLPSLEEMVQLVIASHTISSITLGCSEYWTSTQHDSPTTWARSVQNDQWPTQDYEAKTTQLCVMPVRGF